MALVKKAGVEFEAGMFAVDGNIAQSGSKAAAGEIRVYRNEEGQVFSIYKVDAGSKTVQFEGLLAASATLPKKGDTIEIDDKTYYVDSAELVYQSDEAKKIRVTAKLYADLS